jgi:hypothetical protein
VVAARDDRRENGAMGENAGGILKWAAGIIGAVLAGVLIWLLTSPTSPIHQQNPPEDKPILRIVGINVGTASIAGTASADVKVYNEGSATAEACTVWWYSGGKVAEELDQGLVPSHASTSEPFGLIPDEAKSIAVTSIGYDKPGSYRSEFEVSCSGTDVVSRRFVEYVTVE